MKTLSSEKASFRLAKIPSQAQKFLRTQLFTPHLRIEVERGQHFSGVFRQTLESIPKSLPPGSKNGICHFAQFPPRHVHSFFRRPKNHSHHCRGDFWHWPEGIWRNYSFQADVGGQGCPDGQGAVSAAAWRGDKPFRRLLLEQEYAEMPGKGGSEEIHD